MKGKFITFEGPEGSGKTTIIRRLKEDLLSCGYKVMTTREPGGSKISEEIRNVILRVENTKMNSVTEALLYAASRSQHLTEVIHPALEEGYLVLCDRYIDSSLAYQGYARGLGIDEVYKMNNFATSGFLPGLTIYIDVKPEVGLKRIKDNHRNINRLDLEQLSFHEQVYRGYQEVAKRFPERICVVPGELPQDDVYNEVKRVILEYLEH